MKRQTALLATLLLATSQAFAADYTVDPDHTSVGFKIKHLAISSVSGRFTDVKGTFSYDPAKVADAKAEATIAVKSINTEQAKRDEHLRSPDFFNVPQFPDMSFKSTKIIPGADKTFKAQGDLTIHGVTKPVTFDVTYGGETKDMYGNQRAAFEATAKINRKDFGLTWNKALETGGLVVGDDVTIMLEVEGIQKKS